MRQVYLITLLFCLPLFTRAEEAKYQSSVYAWFMQGFNPAAPELASLKEFNIKEVRQGFPDSRTERLQNTAIIECDCNSEELARIINQKFSDKIFAEPVPAVRPLYEPNDMGIMPTWPSCGQNLPVYHLDKINAREAWDYTQGSAGVKIAIIDQGFNPNHPDFINADGTSQIAFWDGQPFPPTHGTFVAGCAAAATDNAIGIAGIGNKSKLLLYSTMGNYNSLFNAAMQGAKVINISWGGLGSSQTEQLVIDEIHRKKIVVVAAAGNGAWGITTMPYYPASYNHVISVTSVGPNDNHEHQFLHQNDNCKLKTLIHQHNSKVDLSAPGYDIVSTWTGGGYGLSSGTSFASPIVAGAVALMISVNPDLTPDQIESILKCSADNVDNLNTAYSGHLGAGRLNAGKAVKMAYQEKQAGNLSIALSKNTNCKTGKTIVEIIPVGGISPFSYTMNGIAKPSEVVIKEAGTYIFEVNDGACLSKKDTLLIDIYTPLEVNNQLIEACPGDNILPAEHIHPAGGSGKFNFLLYDDGNSVNVQQYFSLSAINDTLSLIVEDLNTGCVERGMFITEIDEACTVSSTADQDEKGRQIKLYPNPARDYFFIETNTPGLLTIKMMDATGRTVYSGQTSSGTQTDISGLSKGIYFVLVTNNNGEVIYESSLIRL